MNHEELQGIVVDLAHLLGWEHLHARRSIGKGRRWTTALNLPGWPDLLLWSERQPGRHIGMELKVPPDKLKPEQEACLGRLARAGFECHVIHPSDIDRLPTLFRAYGGVDGYSRVAQSKGEP